MADTSEMAVARDPKRWLELANACRPQGYNDAVSDALSLYRGWSEADALNTLRKLFPRSADRINIVTLDVLRLVVDEQARVFAGEPTFGLVSPDGAPAPDDVQAAWSRVLEGAEALRKLVEVDRLTRAAGKYFVRVTADKRRKRLRLTLFAPTHVFPRYRPDEPHDLDLAYGTHLEIEPHHDAQGKPVRRWEFWSGGEAPENFIVDERGNITKGESNGLNPYTDDEGGAIVPLVAFSDADEDAGPFVMPSRSLITAQRTVNAQVSNIFHVSQHQGFGQWVFTKGERNAESLKGAPAGERRGFLGRLRDAVVGDDEPILEAGPETPFQLPYGWRADHVAQAAPLADLMANLVSYLRQVAITNRIPPSALVEGLNASGVSLAIQRLPLTELRRDRVALLKRPTTDLLNVMRRVWSDAFGDAMFDAYRCTFREGEMALPTDPLVDAQLRQAAIRDGLTSAAREIAKAEGITLDKAKVRAQEIQAEQRITRAATVTDVAASLRERAAARPAEPQG